MPETTNDNPLNHGQIEEFGMRQKKVALVVGTVACFVGALVGMALLVGAIMASGQSVVECNKILQLSKSSCS